MSTRGEQSEPQDIKQKNMKKNIIIFVILSIATFTACVDEVHIDRDFHETQKLVLYCRLCPQLDTTYIMLTNTTLLYASSNSEITNLKDGVVELSADGHTWTRAAYNPTREHFFLTKEEFPIAEGHTYYIRASYSGYEDVSASCIVPMTHDVGFRFDTVSVSSDMHLGQIYNWPHRDVYAEWRDVAGEENHYALMEKVLFTHNDFGDGSGPVITSYYWDFYTVWMYRNNQDYQYVSDDGYDGAVMRFMVDDNLPIEDNSFDEDVETEDSQYFLFFLDRSCYLYEKTLNTGDFDLNFLLLEPMHTYTNIENGYGLFGAFCMVPVGNSQLKIKGLNHNH